MGLKQFFYTCLATDYAFYTIIVYLIIIIMRTYLKVLNFWNACHVNSVECPSKIKSIISVIFQAIYGLARIQLSTHISYNDCENACTLSSSSNRYYDPFAIV